MRSSDSVYSASNDVQSEGETIAVDPEDNTSSNLLRNFSFTSEYSVGHALSFVMGALREIVLSPWTLLKSVLGYIYMAIQLVIIAIYKPRAPKGGELAKPFGRIAVIGAGLTGISSAAHCMAHNFEVVLFEKSEKVGGIWANVNKSSGLQLNSMLYRFHPAVLWSRTFPQRDEIVGQMRNIWKEYGLESRTRFNTKITSVKRHKSSSDPVSGGRSRWVINVSPEDAREADIFDAVIVCVGTCGDPSRPDLPGLENFRGPVLHSSELDGKKAEETEWEGKRALVIGGGASAVEAVEAAVDKGVEWSGVSARDDKWFIPRNIIFDTLLASQPFGREMPLSFIPEWIIKQFHYRDLQWMSPAHTGVFESTPIVNSRFLSFVRSGKASYLRSDLKQINADSATLSLRERGTKSGDPGSEEQVEADIIVLATGFKRPSIDFLPKDLFPEDYERPNLYLQNFPVTDWTVLMTNSAYMNAIGTVGHFHIGIYTRILLTMLLDPSARPIPKDMKLWVDVIRFVKRGATKGAFSFFTYMELTIWVLAFHLFRPDRLRWLFFILFGWGVGSESKSKRHLERDDERKGRKGRD